MLFANKKLLVKVENLQKKALNIACNITTIMVKIFVANFRIHIKVHYEKKFNMEVSVGFTCIDVLLLARD